MIERMKIDGGGVTFRRTRSASASPTSMTSAGGGVHVRTCGHYVPKDVTKAGGCTLKCPEVTLELPL